MDIQKTKLDNGLTVITLNKPSDFSVSIGISVGAGSFQDKGLPYGTAHFVEHMLFKGTENFTNKELNQSINRVGGSLNAFTDFEETKYFTVTPKNEWKLGLNLLAEIVWKHTLPAEEIDKERNVIIEEIKMYHDDPACITMDKLQEIMLKDYPERHKILGTIDSVNEINRDHLVEFINRYYHLSNIVITVVGNIHHEEVIEEIIKTQIPNNKTKQNSKPELIEVPYAYGKHKLFEPSEQSIYSFGLFGPHCVEKEVAAFEILLTILGENESSRLFRRIREDKGLAYMLTMGTEYFSDHSVMYGCLAASSDKFEEIEVIIEEEMVNISIYGVTQRELEESISYIKGKNMLNFDNSSFLNDYISGNYLLNKPINPYCFLELIGQTTIEDVQFVAQKYFTLDNFVTVELIGDFE